LVHQNNGKSNYNKYRSFYLDDFATPVLPVVITANNLQIGMMAEQGIQLSLFKDVVVAFIDN